MIARRKQGMLFPHHRLKMQGYLISLFPSPNKIFYSSTQFFIQAHNFLFLPEACVNTT